MTKQSKARIFLSLIVVFLIPGCTGALGVQEIRSREVGEIETLLQAYEDAWNNHDQGKLLPLLDKEFIMWVWVGGERKLILRKETYAFYLRDLLVKYRYVKFGEPTIWIKDDQGTASLSMSVDGRNVRGIFRLIRKQDKWLMLEWEF